MNISFLKKPSNGRTVTMTLNLTKSSAMYAAVNSPGKNPTVQARLQKLCTYISIYPKISSSLISSLPHYLLAKISESEHNPRFPFIWLSLLSPGISIT